MARARVPKADLLDADEFKREKLRKLKPGQLTELLLHVQALRKAAKDEKTLRTHEMELIAQVMFENLDFLEQEGFTAHGVTAYSYILTTARAVDPSELRELVLADPERNIGLLTIYANLKGVQQWMLEHAVVDTKGNDITPLPAGVEIVEHRKLGVKKKQARK